jgi:phosphoglycolate phosphatase
MIRTVLWDWNGTLLDDLDSCVATLNVLRAARSLAPMTRAQYRASFGFPVRAFYEATGFDFSTHDYLALSRDFIAEYRRRADEMTVAPGARLALAQLAAVGITHLVVSAMEAGLLGEMLAEHGLLPSLRGFFGTRDHGAGSKVALGVEAMRRAEAEPETALVVGDTLHDLELAQAIGCRAVLYAGGHQHRPRLEQSGVPVVGSFAELVRWIEADNREEAEPPRLVAPPQR